MTAPAPAPLPEVGCTIRPSIAPRPKTIAVNGVEIPRAAIARETQNHSATKPIEAWQAAARALVIRELLLGEARRLGHEPAPITDEEGRRETDEEALIRGLVEREVVTPTADEATCRRHYEANRARFRSPALYAVRHILLPAAPGDDAARGTARQHAYLLIAAITAEPASFAALAAGHSACPSGKLGGALGEIGPGQTVPEFEAALATAPLGRVSPEPLESRYGFHVVLVEDRRAGRDLPFELVRTRIAEQLERRVRRTAIRQYITLLAGRAEITGVALEAGRSPLVQ